MHLGFAMYDPRFTFWTLAAHGAQTRALELGVQLSLVASPTLQEQIAGIEQLISKNIDALIIGPVESAGLMATVARVTSSGIPVLIVSTAIPGSDVSCTIASDNRAGAGQAAAYLAERLHGRGNIVHLCGPGGGLESADRAHGFRDVVAQHPGLRIGFEEAGDWTRATGARLMRAALAANPDVQAVFAANDPTAYGAIDVLAEQGRTGEIIVVGFDGLPESLKAIRAGQMAATVRQSPLESGRLAVELALRARRNEPLPALVYTDTTLITTSNLADATLDLLDILPDALRSMVESNEMLARERTMFRTLIDSLPDTHAFVKDRESRFIVTNTAHLKTLGVARLNDVIGKTDFELFPTELAEQYYADEQTVMRSGVVLNDRVERVIDQDGNYRWYLTTKVPLRDERGVVSGLVGMSRDITSLKMAEQAREQLQEQLIDTQQAALRELSTPLIPISDAVMIMPLIGTIDTQRAQQILETLLTGVAAQGTEVVILDITGVTVVDTQVANALVQAAQAVKLLGTQVMITGIRPEIAQTLVGLGVDLQGIVTRSTVQSGVAWALQSRNKAR